MKKISSSILALTLILALGLTALADEAAPSTPEEQLIFDRYGEAVYNAYGYDLLSCLDENGEYPVNDLGMTYGPGSLAGVVGERPDLIKAKGENGIAGYILAVDEDLPMPVGQNYLEIPIYNLDMEIIDVFRISNGNSYGTTQQMYVYTEDMTIEEARVYIRNKGRGEADAIAVPMQIEGFDTTFEGYEIDGAEHVKLRDLVIALADSEYAMTLDWSYEDNTICLTIGEATADEIVPPAQSGDRNAMPSYTDIYLNDAEMYISMYLIDDSNYINIEQFEFFVTVE